MLRFHLFKCTLATGSSSSLNDRLAVFESGEKKFHTKNIPCEIQKELDSIKSRWDRNTNNGVEKHYFEVSSNMVVLYEFSIQYLDMRVMRNRPVIHGASLTNKYLRNNFTYWTQVASTSDYCIIGQVGHR